MRYIANENGYLLQVSFGAMIECNGLGCTEYTGDVPAGYDSLADWFAREGDKLHRWHIVKGQLTLDEDAPEPEVYVPPEPEVVPTISIEKLWENASRTSAFASQTIALDLSAYDEVRVDFCLNHGDYNKYILSGRCRVGETVAVSFIWAISGVTYSRTGDLSANGIYFNSGYYAGGTDNRSCIPLRIYGIKGVPK